MNKTYNTIIHSGLIFLIIFTPLAFGTVEVWSITIMELIVLIMVSAWFLKMIHQGELRFVKTPLTLPITLFVILILFQLLPLPPSVLKHLSPNTYNLYKLALPGYDADGSPGVISPGVISPGVISPGVISYKLYDKNTSPITYNSSTYNVSLITYNVSTYNVSLITYNVSTYNNTKWRSISIYSHATKTELFKILAYIAIFFIVVNNIRTRRQIHRLILSIIIMGFLLAVFSIIQKFTWNGKIFWFRENTQGGSPFGPFVNRNHFAGYMELVIPLSLGLLVSQFTNFAFSQSGSWRYRLSAWESRLSKNALLIFIIVIMTSALFLSLSRGGILSFLFSLAFFIFFLSSKPINCPWKLEQFIPQGWVSKQSSNFRFLNFYFLTSIFLFSILFLLWLGIDPVLERLATLSNPTRVAQDRAIVWQDTWQMSKDFPLLGTGLGTYQHLYPVYKTLPQQLFFEHAHNDYLELLAEVGFMPFVLLIGAILYLWVNMVKGWHRRKNPYIRGVVAGILAATLALLLHSLGEFNFRIPSNALLFSLMLGIGVSLLSLVSSHPSPIKICFHTFRLKRWQQWLLFPCLIVVTLYLGFSILGEYLSLRAYQAIERIILPNSRNQDILPFFSSADSQLYFILGKRYMELREKSARQNGSWKVNKGKLIFDPGPEARELTRLGIENLHKAVELNPSNAYYHLYLGWAYAVSRIDNQRVEREFTLARYLDPTNQFIQHYLKTEFPDLYGYDSAKTLNR